MPRSEKKPVVGGGTEYLPIQLPPHMPPKNVQSEFQNCAAIPQKVSLAIVLQPGVAPREDLTPHTLMTMEARELDLNLNPVWSCLSSQFSPFPGNCSASLKQSAVRTHSCLIAHRSPPIPKYHKGLKKIISACCCNCAAIPQLHATWLVPI